MHIIHVMPVKLTGPVFLFQVFGFHHHSFPNVSSDDEDVSQNLGSQKMVHVVDAGRHRCSSQGLVLG